LGKAALGGEQVRTGLSNYPLLSHPLLSVFPGDCSLPTQMDLISTIGESAALGAAGVILWGDSVYTSSMVSETQPAY
jgi:hypothetical protein